MSLEQIADVSVPDVAAAPARGRPIQWHLALFGIGILVPVLIIAGIVATRLADNERARFQRDALDLARSVAVDIDRELDTTIAMAQALALAPSLQDADFAEFDAYARKILNIRGNVVVLRDLAGQQLVNVLLPFGAKMPIGQSAVLAHAGQLAVKTGRPVITDLALGTLVKSPMIVVNVPVLRHGEAAYVVNLRLTPERIRDIVNGRELPNEFVISVFDSRYALIARSQDQEKYVGTKSSAGFQRLSAGNEGTWVGTDRLGVPVSGAYVRPALANWRVRVTVPTAALEAPLRRSLLFIAALAAVGLGVSIVLALLYGRRLARPIQELAATAASLGRGEMVAPIEGSMREINQVSETLATTARTLKQQAHERDVAQALLRRSEERQRRKIEEALARSEQQLRLLVDSVKDYAILMLDPDGMVATWSKGAERIKGYRPEEIIGRHFSIFHSAQDVADGKPQHELKTAIAEGRSQDAGWRLRKDGSAFWGEVMITPIYNSAGTLTGFSKVTRDITERMTYETALQEKNGQLQAAVNELDAFSYSVSHDLRAPLRAIDGFSRILVKEHAAHLSPQAREYLQLVRANTEQMGHLVDDLLRFSRLGRQPLSKQQVATEPMIEQVVCEARLQAKGRDVTVSVAPVPPVCGDAALLKQVFVNLIDNAFKYTRHRDDAIIEIGAREIEGEQVFFVRDNGAGFDMKYSGQLFKVFQRLHRADEFEGTGVGLAIVQRIIQRHGGRVWADAALGEGATFYFTTEGNNHA